MNLLTTAMGDGAKKLLSGFLSNDFVEWEDLTSCLDYTLLMDPGRIENIFGVDDALYRRIRNLYQPGLKFDKLMRLLHTKRLTDAALRRALLHIVLHMEREPFLEDASKVITPYARVLGFSKKAAPLLKMIREKSALDLIQKPAQGRLLYERTFDKKILYETDMRVSELYEQIAAKKSGRTPVSEWKRQQIIIE